jgi:hypothetical protein
MRAYAAVLLLLISPAWAAEMVDDSANHWLPACKDLLALGSGDRQSGQSIYAQVGRAAQADECGGYVWGIADTLGLLGKLCTPRNVTKGQILRVVITTLDRSPERLHEAFPKLVIDTLIRTWPCR